MPDEQELILSCARSCLPSGHPGAVLPLIGRKLDWEYVLRTCHKHAVGPLVYRALKASRSDAVPPLIMKELQEQFYSNLAHNMRLERELAQLIDALEGQGIPAVPFKGPALAKSAYGNVAFRVFGDLDIIIRKKDVHHAIELMRSMGYHPEVQLDQKQMDTYLNTFYEVTLTAPGKAPVEVHWELYADHFAFPIEGLSIWDDHTSHEPESGYRTIAPEKLVLMLCVHGTQHYWERLSWICDVAALLRNNHDLDWDDLLSLARITGGRRMVFLGLSLAYELVDAPVPDPILHRMRKDRTVGRAVKAIRARLFEGPTPAPGVLETCIFYVMMRERIRDKALIIFRTMTRPVPGKWHQLGSLGPLGLLRNFVQHMRIGCTYGLTMARTRWRRQVRVTAG